jgi:hypothetical protein
VTHLRLDVYDPLNQTYQGTLSQSLTSEFVDEFNSPGYGTVTVPLFSADAALLVKDAVVRVLYRDDVRFAWFVETRERDLANSSGQQTLTASGRGLLAWLEDAVLYPQGGLADFLAPDRPFNWASGSAGGWRTSGNYQAALGVQWKNDTTSRKNLPVRWKDPSAQWIWRTDPETVVQRGTVNWFYRDFTLTDPTRVKFFASCDNSMDVYLDGQQIMSSSDFDQEAASPGLRSDSASAPTPSPPESRTTSPGSGTTSTSPQATTRFPAPGTASPTAPRSRSPTSQVPPGSLRATPISCAPRLTTTSS